ncbi:hypothetical protein KAS42_01220 [bacterium]|nr:hypothetical protein [bacterium]
MSCPNALVGHPICSFLPAGGRDSRLKIAGMTHYQNSTIVIDEQEARIG